MSSVTILVMDFSGIHGKPQRRNVSESRDDAPKPVYKQSAGRFRHGSAAYLTHI